MTTPNLAPPVAAASMNSAKLDDTDPDEIRHHLDDSDDTYHNSTYTAFHDKDGGKDGLEVIDAPAPPPAQGAAGPPPNGGLKAWLQVASGFCVFFNSWGVLNTFGVFQTYYETGELFVASSSDISWIGSIQAYCVLVFGLLSGPIYDRGYLRSLMAIGSFLIVFGFMMLSISTQYWHAILAQGFCVGIGAGLLFIPAVAVLPQYFTTRMALAMGIAASGSSLGGVIYPVAFLNLLNKIGFAWSVRIIGFIALATLITPVIFMEMRVKPIKPRAVLDWTVFTDWPFAFFTLSTMFGFAGLYVMLFYISFYAFATGIASRHMAFYLVPILNAGSMFGRTLPNALADKVGPLNGEHPTFPFCACLPANPLSSSSCSWCSLLRHPHLCHARRQVPPRHHRHHPHLRLLLGYLHRPPARGLCQAHGRQEQSRNTHGDGIYHIRLRCPGWWAGRWRDPRRAGW